jgi:glycosyltransferase involved in cell wall biosynthesis
MISIIIPCKNRLDHLKECIPGWVNQTYKDIELIIVDYNCPQKTGDWVKENHPFIHVVRASVGVREWNLCAARNLGIKNSAGDILGIFDADTIMEPNFIEDCLNRLTEDNFLCGYPIGKAHGCCVVHKKNMYAVGGYNETLKGWGFDDQCLYNRFTNASLHERNPIHKYIDIKMISFNENLIDLIRHDDSLRVQYQKYKKIQSTNHINSHTSLHSNCFIGL